MASKKTNMEKGLSKAAIAPLEWNDDSTTEEYEDFFWRFESLLISNGIDTTQLTAIGSLYSIKDDDDASSA